MFSGEDIGSQLKEHTYYAYNEPKCWQDQPRWKGEICEPSIDLLIVSCPIHIAASSANHRADRPFVNPLTFLKCPGPFVNYLSERSYTLVFAKPPNIFD